MYGVIEEANGSDTRGQSYIIWVTKTDRLMIQNMKHICSTLITTEQYLCEQLKKAAGQLGDISMQIVPLEQIRTPSTCAAHNINV